MLNSPSGAITIEQMLVELTSGGERVHRLVYVVGTGKRKGELSEFVGYYGAPKPRQRGVHVADREASDRQPRKKHMESGTLPLTKFGTQELRTLFIYNIIRFNGKQVV